MKSYIKYIAAFVIILAIGVLFYKMIYIPKTTYEKTKPIRGNLQVEVFGIGNLGAKNIYNITSQTGGKILSLLHDEGEWVKRGELLIKIDPVDLPILIEQAEAAAKKALFEAVASKKELNSLEAQKELALLTFRRYEKLKKDSFVSEAEYDKAKSDLLVLEAQIEAAKARIKSANLESLKAKKSIESFKTKLSRYKIFSPVDGYIIERNAEVAQTVQPSEPIFKIVDPNTVWIKAYIDEKNSGDIKKGQKAVIKLRSKPKIKYEGIVERVVAQSDPVTLEREIDISFKKLPIPFYINEQAEVTIATKSYTDVLKIPSKFLTYNKKRAGVWTSVDGKARFVPVKIVARNVDEIAVEGVSEDSTILLESIKKKPLKDGMRVH